MNLQIVREKIQSAANNADVKAGRKELVELSKEILSHIGGYEKGYDIADVRNNTRLGHYIEMMRQGRGLSEANVVELVESVAKSYFQMELAAEQNEAKEVAPKATIQVNEDVEVELVKWEGYGKKRVYIKRVGVIAKREDLGMVENGKYTEPKDFDNIRCVKRNSLEWQAVIDDAMAMLK